jgi:hypothetical protein
MWYYKIMKLQCRDCTVSWAAEDPWFSGNSTVVPVAVNISRIFM